VWQFGTSPKRSDPDGPPATISQSLFIRDSLRQSSTGQSKTPANWQGGCVSASRLGKREAKPIEPHVEEARDHGRHARVFRAARFVSSVRAADLHATKPVWSHPWAVRAAVWAIVETADRRMPGAATSRGSARRGHRAARPALAIRWRASDAGAD